MQNIEIYRFGDDLSKIQSFLRTESEALEIKGGSYPMKVMIERNSSYAGITIILL